MTPQKKLMRTAKSISRARTEFLKKKRIERWFKQAKEILSSRADSLI